MSSPSQQLDLKYQLLGQQLREASERFFTHPDLAELIPSLLFRMQCMTRASVPLMELAVEKLDALVDVEPAARGVKAYLEKLIPEEVGHHEWVLDGLEALGIPRKEVLARIPPPTIASMIGAQYYWIHHHHPIALIGFIKVVEADPATIPQIDGIIAKTGLPRDAFRYHIRHAHLEIKHNNDLDNMLDEQPLTDDHWAIIGVNLARTLHLAAVSLEQILQLHDGPDGAHSPDGPSSSAGEEPRSSKASSGVFSADSLL